MAESWRKSSYSGGGNGGCVEMTWRKSSYSGGSGNGNCVEVAVGAEAIGVRDSKNVTGPTLEFTVDQWRTFLMTAR
jgi:Domain of unknown function (DUF397)